MLFFSKINFQILRLITARNEVGARLFSRACVILFTGRGVCLNACWDTPPQQTTPQSRPLPREQTHPPPQSMLGDTVNTRAVRILLECNLVIKSHLSRDFTQYTFPFKRQSCSIYNSYADKQSNLLAKFEGNFPVRTEHFKSGFLVHFFTFYKFKATLIP